MAGAAAAPRRVPERAFPRTLDATHHTNAKEEIAMSERHVVIVGGGLAGLSAGCYARAAGLRTTVVEHNIALGACAPPGHAVLTPSTAVSTG